jgi:hypothetical protein
VIRESVFGRKRWTNELLVTTPTDLSEGLLVEELFTSGWQVKGPSRFPSLAEKLLDASGPKEEKQPCLRRIDMEGVGDVARPIDQGASNCFDYIITMPDADLAGEDHEELVFVLVDMKR